MKNIVRPDIRHHSSQWIRRIKIPQGGFMKPADNKANQGNSNKGSKGTNRQYDQVQGNRGKQKNPNKKTK